MKNLKLNDRKDLRTLREAIESKLAEMEKQHGITFTVGGISYERDGSIANIKVAVTSAAAAEKTGGLGTPEALAYTRDCELFDLQPEWLGQEFTDMEGSTWRVVGLKPRSRKYPVLCQTPGGKIYKLPATRVRRAFIYAEAES